MNKSIIKRVISYIHFYFNLHIEYPEQPPKVIRFIPPILYRLNI